MPKKNKPKLVNCSPSDVFKTLKKLGGFDIQEGSRHTVIIHIQTGKKSNIPRHNRVKRHLLKDFVEDYLVGKLGYSENDIYKYLRC